ncbi:hypothetical protein AGOR_G00198490 [Albula goreensis]|uniref:SAP domain-containing protein n=1 Tax=Albula goreensis TaxID=1534307 RepID=A0A8T3CSD7_9TELE|nr:hypothetical protein AGOR_G00198490 [Albula goreensis]
MSALAPGSAPSPQSEAVTNELQELSLQSGPSLLPLQERKNVLQLKLQQRRTREELVSQGIMPPLKSPAAFHEQRRSLERARTEDYLKRKIRSRPERSELVRMHILEETSAEPSLQAKQLKLKRARLADNLNDKISHRPGPMELIQKNILPVHCSLKHTITEAEFPKMAGESSSLDEDSSDALSPDLPANQSSPLGPTSLPSPPDTLAHSSSLSPTQFISQAQPVAPLCTSETSPGHKLTNGTLTPAGSRTTSGMTKSQSKYSSDRPSQRSKKPKESKPKVKKLKYHQYIPPDQKAEREPPPQLDDSYAKILHQQQLFLQLQIINQQQQHYNYHTILPAPPKPPGDHQTSSNTGPSPSRNVPTSSAALSNQSGLNRQSQAPVGGAKPVTLPPNLDDFKVAELKHELKLRSLPVSGTKNDLIERLKNYQEQNGGIAAMGGTSGTGALKCSPPQQHSAQPTGSSPIHGDTPILQQSMERGLTLANLPAMATSGTPHPTMHFGSTSSSPPLSPTLSDRSYAGMNLDETTCNGDVFGETVSSPLTQLSLHPSPLKEESASPTSASSCRLSQHALLSPGAGSLNKDQMLQEKDKQIEELTRMLRQKQRLVETLRSQLEQGKRDAASEATQGALKDEPAESLGDAAVKEEAKEVEEAWLETLSATQKHMQLQQSLLQQQQMQSPGDQSQQQKEQQQMPGDQSQQQKQLPLRAGDQSQTAQVQQVLLQQCQQKPSPPQQQVKRQKQLQKEAVNVSQVFLSSQSGTTIQAPSFCLDLLKTHPAPTLLTDSNGNHYLIAVTSHSEGQRNGSTQGKATSRVTLQRLHSSPSKIPVQSAPQPATLDNQSKQPLQPGPVTRPNRKGQKTGLHVLTGSSQQAGLSLSAPPNLQAFFLGDESSQPGGHTPTSPTYKLNGDTSLDHPLFSPPSPGLKQASSPVQHGKENGSCSQHMDDLFDILIQSGEMSSGLKANPDPSLSCLHSNTPPLSPTPAPSALHLSPPAPPKHPETSRQPTGDPHAPRTPGDGGGTCAGSGRLEDFLESTTGTPLIGVEPDVPLTLIDDLHSQMLSTSSILDHPPSPMDTCELTFTPQPPGLDFGEVALDSMDWLDITMGGGGTGGVGLAPLGSHMPTSVFSADFLDSPDLQLHWESCL